MPLKSSYSNITKRFDFGVPLEDICTQYEIHPRLLCIFQQAYGVYVSGDSQNIEEVLNEEWCLNDYLELKHRFLYEPYPWINVENVSTPGFFWVIRHFLGLLPVPLIPVVTCTHKFPWTELSRKCRKFLQSKTRNQDDNYLSCSIGRTLTDLPREHIFLLNALIAFIKGCSKKKFYKTSLVFLAKYYCDAIFVRPFRPGHHNKDNSMLPLLIYIITRWHRILKHSKTETIPSLLFENGNTTFKTTVDSYVRTNIFYPTSIIFNKEQSTDVKYIKDTECQTDASEHNDANFTGNFTMTNTDLNNISLKTKKTYDEQHKEISFQSFIGPLKEHNMYVSSLVNIKEENIECERCEAFNSIIAEEEQKNNWDDVMKEVSRTIEKVDGYNYEMETCNVELVNDNKWTTSEFHSTTTFESESSETNYDSVKEKNDNYVNDTLFKSVENECKEVNENFTRKSNRQPESNYVNDISFKSIENESKELNEHFFRKCNRQSENSAYRSFYNSDEELYNLKERQEDNRTWDQFVDDQNTSTYTLKKFKISLDFFRTLPPKIKWPRYIFKGIPMNNLKYKKM